MDSDDSTADILAANMSQILMWITILTVTVMIMAGVGLFLWFKYHG